jgi:hypothetical protein
LERSGPSRQGRSARLPRANDDGRSLLVVAVDIVHVAPGVTAATPLFLLQTILARDALGSARSTFFVRTAGRPIARASHGWRTEVAASATAASHGGRGRAAHARRTTAARTRETARSIAARWWPLTARMRDVHGALTSANVKIADGCEAFFGGVFADERHECEATLSPGRMVHRQMNAIEPLRTHLIEDAAQIGLFDVVR